MNHKYVIIIWNLIGLVTIFYGLSIVNDTTDPTTTKKPGPNLDNLGISVAETKRPYANYQYDFSLDIPFDWAVGEAVLSNRGLGHPELRFNKGQRLRSLIHFASPEKQFTKEWNSDYCQFPEQYDERCLTGVGNRWEFIDLELSVGWLENSTSSKVVVGNTEWIRHTNAPYGEDYYTFIIYSTPYPDGKDLYYQFVMLKENEKKLIPLLASFKPLGNPTFRWEICGDSFLTSEFCDESK